MTINVYFSIDFSLFILISLTIFVELLLLIYYVVHPYIDLGNEDK